MKKIIILSLISVFPVILSGQGIFEPAGINLSGYTRTTGYLGVSKKEDPALRSLYSETSLKIKAKAGSIGQAYTDIRYRAGAEYGSEFSAITIREAYIDVYLSKVQFRIGKQISPWGRADGWNPTDNLTPYDYFARSPDPDDMRIGNYRIRGQYQPMTWLKIEADLVPVYTPSVYRFDMIDMPDFVSISQPLNPGFEWDKSSVAGRLDLIFPAIEGSVSWFRGYDPLPMLRSGALQIPPLAELRLELLQSPFRQQTFGADFASVIGKTGMRGEIAWKTPEKGDSADPCLPNSDIQWVISFDREVGPFRIIAGYQGRFVQDFTNADPPPDFNSAMLSDPGILLMLPAYVAGQVGYYNRILYDQTHEWSHSALIRPSVTLLHENLDLEISSVYNFTTGEYLVYPKATYHLADGLIASAGYQYYDGDRYTRFSWIKRAFNGPLIELRLTF